MGLGAYPCNDEELSLQMLGMHGTVYANYAVDRSDLLLAFGVRFDDRVTGKLEAFASRAKLSTLILIRQRLERTSSRMCRFVLMSNWRCKD
ncbi:hypothetical protein Prudu_877S000200 [Prunus dulcis]|nr:hypothetical protein Prudu_877S000200 [Prunus dulcis]